MKDDIISNWNGEGEEWFCERMGRWGWLWKGSWRWGGGYFHHFIQPNDAIEVTILQMGDVLRWKWKEIETNNNENE